jgi:ATP-dependent DNA ligase
VIDGEGPDGVSDFGALHSGKCNELAQLYAFDMLAGDGENHRRLPLSLRKANLDRLVARQKHPTAWTASYFRIARAIRRPR